MTNRIAAGLIAAALVLGLLVGAAGTILATGGPVWAGGYPSQVSSGGWGGYGPMMGGGYGPMMGGGWQSGSGPMMDADDMGPYASSMPDWMWQHMGWAPSDDESESGTPR